MIEQRINFKIVSNENEEVYIEGYVNIPSDECEDEEIDWYYFDSQGFATPQMFIEHDGVDGFKGATDRQKEEIRQFLIDYREDSFWINTVICQSNEDENRTHVRENVTLIINEGAKMECEIKEPHNYRGDFVVEVIPRFNGKFINLAKYMSETGETFDPYSECDEYSTIENGHIYFEISKDYFDGDEDDKMENIEIINKEARRIYARYLTRELCICSIYGESMEQSMDDHYEDEWLFKMNQMVDKSDEELEEFLKNEGYIDAYSEE